MRVVEHPPETLLSLALPCELGSLRALEGPLRSVVAGDSAGADDLRLAVWELTSNAIIHSGGGPKDTVRLTIEDRHGSVRVTVEDPGPGFCPSGPVVPDDHRVHGRGLLIIEQIALRWGVVPCAPSRVWCDLTAQPGALDTPAAAVLVTTPG